MNKKSKPTYSLHPSTKKSGRSNKRRYILLALVLLVLLSGGLFALNRRNNRTTDVEKQQQEQRKNDELSTNKPTEKEQDATKTPSDAKDIDKLPPAAALSIAISSFSQENGAVSVASTITGSEAEGQCVFSFTTEGGKPVIRQTQSNNKQCSAAIPEVEFDKLGLWNLEATFRMDNTKSIATKQVEIK